MMKKTKIASISDEIIVKKALEPLSNKQSAYRYLNQWHQKHGHSLPYQN